MHDEERPTARRTKNAPRPRGGLGIGDGIVAGSIVIAVVVAVLWTGHPWSSPSPPHPPLPAYGLELSSDVAPRFPRTDRLTIREDDLLAVTLRPAERVTGPVAVRAFRDDGSGARPWAVHFEQASSGAFHVSATASDLPGLHPGHQRVVFLVGRPDAVLALDVTAARQRGPGPDFQILEGEIEIRSKLNE